MNDTEWNTDDWDGCEWADYLMPNDYEQDGHLGMTGHSSWGSHRPVSERTNTVLFAEVLRNIELHNPTTLLGQGCYTL